MATAQLVPLLVIGLGIWAILWIYSDAKRHAEVGKPVVWQVGNLTVDTPAAWAAGSLVLSILFLPLYLKTRP
jgi:hypothetical protein